MRDEREFVIYLFPVIATINLKLSYSSRYRELIDQFSRLQKKFLNKDISSTTSRSRKEKRKIDHFLRDQKTLERDQPPSLFVTRKKVLIKGSQPLGGFSSEQALRTSSVYFLRILNTIGRAAGLHHNRITIGIRQTQPIPRTSPKRRETRRGDTNFYLTIENQKPRDGVFMCCA
jgi:hypothetical protein